MIKIPNDFNIKNLVATEILDNVYYSTSLFCGKLLVAVTEYLKIRLRMKSGLLRGNELSKAYARARTRIANAIADVIIICCQLSYACVVDDTDINQQIEKKIKKQLKEKGILYIKDLTNKPHKTQEGH